MLNECSLFFLFLYWFINSFVFSCLWIQLMDFLLWWWFFYSVSIWFIFSTLRFPTLLLYILMSARLFFSLLLLSFVCGKRIIIIIICSYIIDLEKKKKKRKEGRGSHRLYWRPLMNFGLCDFASCTIIDCLLSFT